MPIVVKRKKGESIHDMLNRFYQLIKQTNIIEDIKEKQEFVKPSQKRHEKKKALERSG
jgi:ribosomal protein S21